MTILENYELIGGHVGRQVSVVVAAKGRTDAEIKEVYRAGGKLFGENTVQKGAERFDFYHLLNVNVHMLGHLQSNKVKEAVRVFDCIETIDSIELAKKVDEEAGEIGKQILILLQVNISNDSNKFGFKAEDVEQAVVEIQKLKNCILVGLMTITSMENNREDYKAMKQLYDKVSIKHKYYLSMGMSDSYKIAVEEGSNMIRIGTAIFGPRQ
jgi:PLP dependent protein